MPPSLLSHWAERVVVADSIDIPGIAAMWASSRVHHRL